MKILYTSLLPRLPFKQHEQENLEFFRNSTEYYNYQNVFDFCIATAHPNTYDYLYENIRCHLLCTQFCYDKKMSEERGHEISYSKMKLFKYVSSIETHDYLFYIDSDMQIDSKDIMELCKSLKDSPDIFVNIPYPLRDLKCVTNTSFGCYIIPYSILKENPDLYEVIYKTREADRIIHRVGAPDCNIREELLRRGYKELHAHSVRIKHYINESNYLEYDNGVIKEF